MFNKLAIILAFLAILIMPISGMAKDELSTAFTSDDPFVVDKEDKSMTLRFEGKDPEKGTWHLFVKNKANNDFADTPLADELNAIAPAAGVQFNLEF